MISSGALTYGTIFFDGAPARRKPRERQRGAEEREHFAACDPFGELRGALRELPLEIGAGFGALSSSARLRQYVRLIGGTPNSQSAD